MGASVVILLILASLCWLAVPINLFGVAGRHVTGDAAMGQGIGWVVTMVFTGLTWLWIGGLLLKAGTQDLLPGWQSTAAVFLYVGACLSAIGAIYLMVDTTQIWPAVCVVGLPPIVIGYIWALYRPGPRGAVQAGGLAWAMQAAMVFLTLLPYPWAIQKFRAEQASQAARLRGRAEYAQREKERTREKNLAKLQAMPADASINDWWELFDGSSGVRNEAIEAFKKLDRRQSDLEEMMGYGVMGAMGLMQELDLQVTPKLCQASHAYFEKRAKYFKRRKINDPIPYSRKDNDLDDCLGGIRWLQARGCNCKDGIALLLAATNTYLESPDRHQLIASLEALKQD
jgi:hypothetical protein